MSTGRFVTWLLVGVALLVALLYATGAALDMQRLPAQPKPPVPSASGATECSTHIRAHHQHRCWWWTGKKWIYVK